MSSSDDTAAAAAAAAAVATAGKVNNVENEDEDCTHNVSSPVNGRQDYRLNFSEVLEAVPEECQNQQQTMTAHFHIPESNASDVAASDCSSQQIEMSGGAVYTKTEALTARQQVVLWLTRTSMSDLSSMPSLRSLVHNTATGPSNASTSLRHRQQSHARRRFRPVSTHSEKRPKEDMVMQRNYSTKSLLDSGSKHEKGTDEDMMMAGPIRKCETVIALSGMSSSSNSTASAKPAKGTSTMKKSPMNLFKTLTHKSKEGSNNNAPPQQTLAIHSGTATPYGTSVYNGSICESPYPGIRPINRLRSTTSSMVCSRCTSVMSMNNSRMTSRATSQMSLLQASRRLSSAVNTAAASNGCATVSSNVSSSATITNANVDTPSQAKEPEMLCKICLVDYQPKEMVKLQECGCHFCKECMTQYVSMEVMEGAYEISCPDPECEKQGVLQMSEMECLVGKDLMEKHRTFRLNTEVALDANRAWCPQVGCNTICHICATVSSTAPATPRGPPAPVSVTCPKCDKEFCSICSSNWHQGMSCQDHGKRIFKGMAEGGSSSFTDALLMIDGNGDIKRCPMCQVPIERDAGCAQMMCKRCKHVFCWFCLTSLDDDFLLRHYDSGACKGRLGHSRASVLWHRAQVIGIFAGFGILLLVASPLLLLAAPCIFCCRCKTCQKLEEKLGEDGTAPSPSGPSRTNSGIGLQLTVN